MVTISAFDFDGTVTHRDSMPLFIKHVLGSRRYYWLMLRMMPSIAMALAGILDRGTVKERLLGRVFRHMPLRQLDHHTYSFHQSHRNLLRPKAVETIGRALAQGHRVVIISASPQAWVSRFFTDRRITVIGTELEESEGKLTGRFSTPNCSGAEKLRRLQLLIPRSCWSRLIVYGDSRGDRELLAAADEPHYRPFK